jgi:hypothetical protein
VCVIYEIKEKKMASLVGTTVANNFEQINKGFNGLGPQTRIFSVNKGTGDHSEAELVSLVKAMTAGVDGTADAVTIAGIAGTVGTDPVYLAVQGSGTVGTSGGDYVADITVALVAAFDQTTGV